MSKVMYESFLSNKSEEAKNGTQEAIQQFEKVIQRFSEERKEIQENLTSLFKYSKELQTAEENVSKKLDEYEGEEKDKEEFKKVFDKNKELLQ